MANPVLTQNWTSYATAVWDYGPTKITYYLEAKYSTQDLTNNNTTIQTRLRCELNYGSASGTSYIEFGCSYADTISGTYQWNVGSEVITEGSSTITHNADGTKTLNLTGKARIDYLSAYGTYNSDLSATVDLPAIARTSTLTSATMSIANNGNSITVTPKITKNNSSFYDVMIIKNGSTTVATLNGVTNNTASSLDSTQRNNVYSAFGTNTSKSFTAYVETYTNSSKTTKVGTTSSITINASLPSYSLSMTTASIAEAATTYNQYKTSGHTNDTFIKYLSQPKVTFAATSSTGSTYGRSITYKVNNTTATSPYTISNYTGQTITVAATDGRKNTSWSPSGLTVINYFTPTITANVVRPSATGSTATVTISGTMYKGTDLTNLETPTISFVYTEQGGSQQTVSITPVLDETGSITTYTGTATLTGLNYKKSVTWSTTITDKLNQTQSASNTLTPGAKMPWNVYNKNDENYFNVNGNLTIKETSLSLKNGKNKFSSNLINYNVTETKLAASTTRICTQSFIPVEPNTTYTISFDTDADIDRVNWCSFTTNAFPRSGETGWTTNYTFTTGSNVKYIMLAFSNSGGASINPSNISNIQLEKGNQATTFEEYINPSVYIDEEEVYSKNNREIYSLNEEKIGTWIDGKPIYRKVVTFDYSQGSSTAGISTGISNVDKIVKITPIINKSGSDFENPFYASSSEYCRVFFRKSGSTIEVRTSATSTSWSFYVILEYTKTTD